MSRKFDGSSEVQEFEQTPGDSEGQGSRSASCGPWGHRVTTEQQQSGDRIAAIGSVSISRGCPLSSAHRTGLSAHALAGAGLVMRAELGGQC